MQSKQMLVSTKTPALPIEHKGGDWRDAINAIRRGYRAIGSSPKLLKLAQRLRQRWVKRQRRVLAEKAERCNPSPSKI